MASTSSRRPTTSRMTGARALAAELEGELGGLDVLVNIAAAFADWSEVPSRAYGRTEPGGARNSGDGAPPVYRRIFGR